MGMSEPCKDLAAVVEASRRSMPGSRQQRLEGWICRSHLGETARANSVSVGQDLPEPLAAAVDRVEHWYASLGRRTIFQVTGENPDLGEELDRRGYTRDRDSLIMTAPVSSLARLDRRPTGESHLVEMSSEPTETFASLMSSSRLAETTFSPHVAHRYVDVTSPIGEVLGVGHACIDGAFIGLSSLHTLEAFRGQGVATAAIDALVHDERAERTDTVWLQVMKSNHGAVRLYESLGFEMIGSYHYRHAPAGTCRH